MPGSSAGTEDGGSGATGEVALRDRSFAAGASGGDRDGDGDEGGGGGGGGGDAGVSPVVVIGAPVTSSW